MYVKGKRVRKEIVQHGRRGQNLTLGAYSKIINFLHISLHFWYFKRKSPIFFKLLVKPFSKTVQMPNGFWFKSYQLLYGIYIHRVSQKSIHV